MNNRGRKQKHHRNSPGRRAGKSAGAAAVWLALCLVLAGGFPAGAVFAQEDILLPEIEIGGMEASGGNGPCRARLSWTGDCGTDMTVTWQDSAETAAAWIEFTDQPVSSVDGTQPGLMKKDAVLVEHKSLLSDGGTQWQADLSGLKPGTVYYYSLCGASSEGGAVSRSETRSFTTGGAGPSDTVTFAYFGDVQVYADAAGEYARWGTAAQNVLFRNPDLAFAVMGGDIVESGISTEQFNLFFDAAEPLASAIPLFGTIGNHESNFLSGKPELYLDSFALPENGPEGFEEEFYSFDYGPVHMLVLNSWVYSGEQKLTEEDLTSIKDWIRQDLSNAPENAWKIAVMHHPVYAVHSDRVANLVKENWAPLFEEGGLDLLLCGHQHVYCRSVPMTDGLTDYENGITQVMGVSGEKFYSSADEFNMERTIYEIPNYQIIRITGDTLELQCFDRSGEELDYVTLSSGGGRDDDTDRADRFSDVHEGDWFYSAVDHAVRKGLFTGVSESIFDPQGTMTRAMFATVTGRLAAADPSLYPGTSFTDVPEGQWFSPYIRWAAEQGVVNGIGGGRFAPEGNITREQMAVMMYRYAKLQNINCASNDSRAASFPDAAQVSDYAREAMNWAVDRGVINGTDRGLEPQGTATRAQVAQIMKNYMERVS